LRRYHQCRITANSQLKQQNEHPRNDGNWRIETQKKGITEEASHRKEEDHISLHPQTLPDLRMAEGLLRALKGDLYEVYSAGVSPKAVDPDAIGAMVEIGIDISRQL
jgi:hypothetical protein